MSIDDQINEIVQKIYVSAADPDGWSETLRTISQLFPGSRVTLNHQNLLNEDLCWTATYDFDDETLRQHYEVYNTPEKNPGLRALLMAKPLEPFTFSSFMSPEEFYGNESVNAMLIPQNIHRGLVNVVDKENANTSLILFRGKEHEDYSPRDLDTARMLGLHLRNAARLAHLRLLSSLRQAHLETMATEARYGILLLSASGRLFDWDPYAESILDSSSLIKVVNGSLKTLRRCAVNRHDFMDFLRSEPLSRDFILKEGETKSIIFKKLPAPFVQTGIAINMPCLAIAVRLIDYEKVHIGTAQQVFRLTPAETRVAELVCKGYSQKEISDQLQISANTLKSHMKRLFNKTETNRQAELTAVLMRFLE